MAEQIGSARFAADRPRRGVEGAAQDRRVRIELGAAGGVQFAEEADQLRVMHEP